MPQVDMAALSSEDVDAAEAAGKPRGRLPRDASAA